MKSYMHSHIHSNTNHSSQGVEATQECTDEWINKLWYVHTMEYYAALKGKEILPYTITWKDLRFSILLC
jgi:hypothetical protein